MFLSHSSLHKQQHVYSDRIVSISALTAICKHLCLQARTLPVSQQISLAVLPIRPRAAHYGPPYRSHHMSHPTPDCTQVSCNTFLDLPFNPPFPGRTFTGVDECKQHFCFLSQTLVSIPSADTFPAPRGCGIDEHALGPEDQPDQWDVRVGSWMWLARQRSRLSRLD